MMSVSDCRLIIALAEEAHFGRAAERCHLSASAVTRAVQRLEQHIGVSLFERDNRSVHITFHGEIYLEYARKALAEWQTLQSKLNNDAHHLKGELSLYCSVTAVYSLLQPIVQRCREQYPEIELRLHTGDQANAIQRVLEHREHIAIAACPDNLPDSLEFQPISSSDFILIQPVESHEQLSVHIKQNRVSNWADIPVVLPERGVGRERMEYLFKQTKIKPNIYTTVIGHEAIVTMVALGFGVGGVPRLVLDNSPQQSQIKLLKPECAFEPFNIGLICHKRHKQNPVVNAFWELGAQI